jgi:hypothetical protein
MTTFNLLRYGQSPSVDFCFEVIRKSGKSAPAFLESHGMNCKILFKYRLGCRPLPPCYWHFFYEYGNLAAYYEDAAAGIVKREEKKEEVIVTPLIPKKNKKRINEFRQRLAI